MFVLPEFAVESIIREGLAELSTDLDMKLTDIFGNLRDNYLVAKYGAEEINKIKLVIQRSQVNVVHSLAQLNNTNLPSFSIHLLSDTEAEDKAGMGDYSEESATPINPQIVVPLFNALSYTATTGKVSVPDTADLSQVYENRWYVDGLGQEFQIVLPISNVMGDKYFTIDRDLLNVNLSNNKVVSSVSMKINSVHYIPTNEQVMIGVHTENALLTRYLYYILKYIFYRNKFKFKKYSMLLSKFNGADFSLNNTPLPENVYSRFITAQFIAYNSWRDEELKVVDVINPFGGVHCLSGSFTPISHNAMSGLVRVPDAADLSKVEIGYVFTDGEGNKFEILSDIDNTIGNKGFNIGAGKSVSMNAGACVGQQFKLQTEAESEREDEVNYDWDTIKK